MARTRVGSPVAIALVSTALVGLLVALVLSFALDDGDESDAVPSITLDPSLPQPSISAPPNTSVGEVAEDFTFEPLDGGGDVDFAELRGGRPAVVNFFRHDCVPCVTEMPDLEDAFQEYGDDVAFVGLSYSESVEDGEELVDRTGVTYATGRDPRGDILAAFEGIGLPTTVFIEADGTIAAAYTRRIRPPELREELEALV